MSPVVPNPPTVDDRSQSARAGSKGRRPVKDVIATGLEVPEGPVVLPDGRIAFVEHHALPTNCCFDGSALWVTDFGRYYETVPGRGRLWRVETDAVGAAVATGAV